MRRDASQVGDVVGDLMQRLRPGKIDERAAIADGWRRISDTPMLRHTRVGAITRGVVTIEVASPPLCSQLAGFRARPLLERLRKALPDDVLVRQLRFIHAEK